MHISIRVYILYNPHSEMQHEKISDTLLIHFSTPTVANE